MTCAFKCTRRYFKYHFTVVNVNSPGFSQHTKVKDFVIYSLLIMFRARRTKRRGIRTPVYAKNGDYSDYERYGYVEEKINHYYSILANAVHRTESLYISGDYKERAFENRKTQHMHTSVRVIIHIL